MTTTTRDAPAAQDPSTAERCMIISVDSHVGPSVRGQLRNYCARQHLEAFDQYVARLEQSLDDKLSVDATKQVSQHAPMANRESLMERSRVEGLQDPHARLRDMDADGVSADVIFHGGLNGQTIPFFNFNVAGWGSSDYDHLEPVGVHIYNQWLADFVSVAPERHVGVAQISVRNIDAAVQELERAKAAGLNAVNLPAPRRDFVPFTEPAWEPVWAACEDLEITLVTHSGGGDLETRHTGSAALSMFILEVPWFGRRGVWQMILSGVFERHPNLHFVPTEQFGDWVPATLKEMDSVYQWRQLESLRSELPRRPSEYFMDNCFVGASFMSHEEAQLAVEAGFPDNLMWGSDYPHPEGSYPYSTLALRKALGGLERPVMDALVCNNAARAFRIDTDRLRPVADRIGPAYSELAEPYAGPRPDAVPSSLAFRDFGHWI